MSGVYFVDGELLMAEKVCSPVLFACLLRSWFS